MIEPDSVACKKVTPKIRVDEFIDSNEFARYSHKEIQAFHHEC